jgi:hypothetical protein
MVRPPGTHAQSHRVLLTPARRCVLGDITRDEKHYTTSWELSKGSFARAMRSLGTMLLSLAERLREQDQADPALYTRAIDCFQK